MHPYISILKHYIIIAWTDCCEYLNIAQILMNVKFLEVAQYIPVAPTLKVHSAVPATVDSTRLRMGVEVKWPVLV